MPHFYSLRVNSLEKETKEAVIIGFEIPEHLRASFQFVAGQYVALEKEIGGVRLRRFYSIVTSPRSGDLKVVIKAIVAESFSYWANRFLKIGDTIKVSLPMGRFVYESVEPEKERAHLAFAAGSGISPIVSIFQEILSNETHSKFVLVYGNKTPEQTIFYKDLLAFKKEYPHRFFIHFVFSQIRERCVVNECMGGSFLGETDREVEDTFLGRIRRDTVDFVIQDKYRNLNFEEFYLCGPPEMIRNVSTYLRRYDIPERQIHFEH